MRRHDVNSLPGISSMAGPEGVSIHLTSTTLSALIASAMRSGVRMSCRPRSAPNAAIITSMGGPPSRRISRGPGGVFGSTVTLSWTNSAKPGGGWAAADGYRTVILANLTTVSHPFHTVPGETYTAAFSLAGNPDDNKYHYTIR